MEEPQRVREIQFVSRHIREFIERYAKKMEETTPEVDEERVLRNSGLDNINAAMDTMLSLYQAMETAIAAHDKAARKFADQYGEQEDALITKAHEDRFTQIETATADFEFRIRKAIGLVELVGGPEAFAVLEACRQEIEILGK